MRNLLILLGLICVFRSSPAIGSNTATPSKDVADPQAKAIVEEYLKLPFPVEDERGQARMNRLQVSGKLSAMPEKALATIQSMWPEIKDPRQKAELLEFLGRQVQTKPCAEFLTQMLKDSDADVRLNALHGIRLMARRTDRFGGKREERRGEIPPKVEGLFPVIVSALADNEEKIRESAVYALADTRDPAAVQELRKCLKDRSESIRLKAACFLTEYQDVSGLPEMRSALTRLKNGSTSDVRFFFEAEMLLASLERLTGKSFGKAPMNPLFSSNSQSSEEQSKMYVRLIQNWSDWFEWEPPKEKK